MRRLLMAGAVTTCLVVAGGCNQESTNDPPGGEQKAAPVLSEVGDQRTVMGEEMTVDFEVSYDEPNELVMNASSADPGLVPAHQLSIDGTGNSRVLNALPTATGVGSVELTLSTVAPNGASDEVAFLLDVLPPFVQSQAALTRPEGSDAAYDGGIAMSDRFVLVGSWRRREVHVFERDGNSWQYSDTIRPNDLDDTAGSQFGRHVDVHGDYVIVGALSDDEVADGAGAAYMFHHDGSAWSQVAKLLPPNEPESAYGNLGSSVAISGSHAIVGATGDGGDGGISRGAAYVFRLDGEDWSRAAKLTAPSPLDFDQFGKAVDVDGSLAVVTIPWGFLVGRRHGVAYVFEGSGSSWTQLAALTPIEPDRDDGFGESVSISGDTVVAGARYPNVRGNDPYAGTAFVFERSGDTYSSISRLTVGDAEPDDKFGAAVAVHGDFLSISAPGREERAVYIFKRVGGDWLEVNKLVPEEGHLGSEFAERIALTEDSLAILAPDDDADPATEEPLLIYAR